MLIRVADVTHAALIRIKLAAWLDAVAGFAFLLPSFETREHL